MSEARTAVLLMAYGTPRTPAEIEPYYTDIRRGRAPTPEQLADLIARYEAIGGISPLAERTEAQRDALQRALDAAAPGAYFVTLGLKHAEPKIESAVAQLGADGFRRIVALVLAPHYSSYSIGQYLDRTTAAAEQYGIEVLGIESWAVEPAFVEFISRDLAQRIAAVDGQRVRVLFTAHSLPQRIIDAGDPYPNELAQTAVAVAERLGIPRSGDDIEPIDGSALVSYSIAWQSAGRTPEPWIGPDILAAIDLRAAAGDTDVVIVSAVGFVADHLEVLYDLDIEATAHAARHGLGFDRTACVNDDATVMSALAARVVARCAPAGTPT